MHDFNWNYVWAALAINFLLVYIIPKVIKKPTGIKVIDNVVLFLNSQKGSLLSSCIVIAIVVYGAHYWVESAADGAHSPTKSGTPDF